MDIITCRAKVSEKCMDGQLWPDRNTSPREDGTYEKGSIVCDHCYVYLMQFSPSGQLLVSEIPSALRRAREHIERH